MRTLNKTILIGRLGRDAEVRAGQNGRERCTFSPATNRRWLDRDGNRHEEADWHNIVWWARGTEGRIG